jgi:hypothetical protein
MRKLFIVLAKIVGLYQMYIGLAYFSSTLMLFKVAGTCSPGEGMSLIFAGVALFGFALLYFWFVRVLLIRTEWLADKIGIKSDDALPTLDKDTALTIGFKLIGIYIFIAALSTLARLVVDSTSYPSSMNINGYIWKYSIPTVMKSIVALILLIRTDWVLRMVKKGEDASNRAIIGGGCMILAVIILIGYRIASNHAARDLYRAYSMPEKSSKSVTDKKTINVNTAQTMEWYRVMSPDDSATAAIKDITHTRDAETNSVLP